MKTFVCIRYYRIEAETEEEAKRKFWEDVRGQKSGDWSHCYSGGLYLKEEEWEEAPEIK